MGEIQILSIYWENNTCTHSVCVTGPSPPQIKGLGTRLAVIASARDSY